MSQDYVTFHIYTRDSQIKKSPFIQEYSSNRNV
jgi:hypothetical protein